MIDIAKHRLINQQLAATNFRSPKDIVGWLGAVQAQDYAMAKWAVGARLSGITEAAVAQSINSAEIVRTHVMRPTWHLVLAEDVRWMTALTAPHINSSVRSMQKKIGLDEKIFKRTNAIIEKSLAGGNHLTRAELMALLKKNKITTDSLQAIHIMFDAELRGLVCNGPMRGKQFTYALLNERVPSVKALKRDEALAELSARYFTSHGPATIQDFIWWSGLPVGDAKAGLEMIKPKLISEKINDQIYWHDPSGSSDSFTGLHPVYFLPAYDEFMISYKDRSASLDSGFVKHAITGNGIFKPIIVANGKVIGTWARTIKKDKVVIKTLFFRASQKLKKKEMELAAQPFGEFLNLKVEIR